MSGGWGSYAEVLGEPIDSLAVRSLLERTGARVDRERGGGAVIECTGLGVVLSFDQTPEAASPVARSVQFLSSDAWLFSAFEGGLPLGCAFGDSPELAERCASEAGARKVTREESGDGTTLIACVWEGLLLMLDFGERGLQLVSLMLESAIPSEADTRTPQ